MAIVCCFATNLPPGSEFSPMVATGFPSLTGQEIPATPGRHKTYTHVHPLFLDAFWLKQSTQGRINLNSRTVWNLNWKTIFGMCDVKLLLPATSPLLPPLLPESPVLMEKIWRAPHSPLLLVFTSLLLDLTVYYITATVVAIFTAGVAWCPCVNDSGCWRVARPGRLPWDEKKMADTLTWEGLGQKQFGTE